MSYATQLAAGVRTPQSLLIVKVPQCANFYAGAFEQGLRYTEDFGNAFWVNVNSADTVDTHEAPDGTDTADTLDFTAATGSFEMVSDFSIAGVTGDGYTGSVWLKVAAGSGTITLMIRKSAGVEETTALVNVTTTWTRFSMAALAASNGGNYRFLITRAVGDLAQVIAWGANMSKIPAAYPPPSAGHVFPYRKREAEAVQTASVMSSPCQANDEGNGSRCYYTFGTCQDVANYNTGNSWEATDYLQGLKPFTFCRKNAPLAIAGADVMPLLESASFAAQKIDQEKAVTQSERVHFKLCDHTATWNWNQDKANQGALTNTGTPSGTFWRRFLRLHRNYANPLASATLKVGFVESGAVEADYETRGKYLMKNLSMSSGGMLDMECTDRLKLLKAKAPAKISETNLLNGAINSAATSIVVDDASEITPPGTGYNVCIELTYAGTNEFVNVTSISGNTLTVQRGRWGTAATSHADNAAFREVLQFGTENPTPASAPLGIAGKDVVKQLAYRAGLTTAEYDATTIDDEFDTWLPGSVSGTTETGTLFKRCGETVGSGNGAIADQTDIEALLRQIREVCMLDLWVNESQQVTGKLFAPARPSVTLTDLTETNDILADSISIDDNEESRYSRVIIAYDLQAGKNGNQLSDYGRFMVRADADAEAEGSYGEARTKTILSPWIKTSDSTTASVLAAHILGRFREPVREVELALELRHDGVECGDYVYVTTARIVNPDGSTDAQRVMQMVKKTRDAMRGRLAYIAVDTGLRKRYGFISAAGAPDYDSATPAQRRYGYIGTATVNRVGTAADPGYHIW